MVCEHGRRKDRCRDCGTGICEHNKLKRYCKDCGANSICEHGRRRDRCKDCGGGSQICQHNKRRSTCVLCGGGEICEHNKVRGYCKDCGGSQICQHNKHRTYCKDCGGSAFCEHNKERRKCKDCGGSAICEHNRERRCKDCGGSAICEHNKQREQCKDCGGRNICEHNKSRSQCKECGGSQICEHNKFKYICPDCGGTKICKSKTTIGCRTTGNRKLNGYCSHCFVNIFPEDPRALMVRKKSKELQVMTHIFSKYDGFKNDKPFYVDLEGGCCETKRRIDLRKLIGNTTLCIEVDENQHKYYIKEKEIERYNDLFMDFSGKYIVIRYNPDKYIDKLGKSKNPMFETRMEILEKSINKHIKRIENGENHDLVEIHHLLYDED